MFNDTLEIWPESRIRDGIAAATAADVERVLARGIRDEADFATLLSEPAAQYLEPMAQEAHRLTRWHFGRTIGLYVPLYLSNGCGADCTYCGYAVRSENRERRVTLTEA
jgi:2-iminoacetate synthase